VLSFVVPAHNVEPYVEQCLGSLLCRAGDGSVEVVVVDDASTDGTRSVVEALSGKDCRVRLLANNTQRGPGVSRNEGVAAAVGDYVWFVDGDDWLFDGALDHVLPRLNGAVDVLFVNYFRVWEDGPVVGEKARSVLARAPSERFTFCEWPDIAGVPQAAWNKIVKRSLLVDHSVQFGTGVGQDVPYTYKVLSAAEAIEIEQFACYAWRSGRAGQVTRTPGEQHLVWSDQWRAALDSCAAQPTQVRAAVFKRMIAHGWSVLADPIRLHGPLRREFFCRFSALYCDLRGPGLPRNAFLASRSWTLGCLRLLPRQARARLPHGVLLLRDRIRSMTIALRRAMT
jgi:CDP-glycerol glycerophosphotransferase